MSYHFSLASPRSVRAERQPVGPNETEAKKLKEPPSKVNSQPRPCRPFGAP